MSDVPLKDLKYSQFHVRSVYCSWKFMLLCINRRLRGTRSKGSMASRKP